MDKEARKLLNPQGEKLVEILQASDEEIEIAELKAQRNELAAALRKHHAYLLEIERAGYGAYSKSDLQIETAAALAKL